jgi:phosphinothricin acetyltransferase
MTQPPPARIRRATLADLPTIVRIYNQSVPDRNATCDLEPSTLEERIPWFHHHDDRYPLWVAALRDRVIGWAALSPYSEKAGYRRTVENSVYVDRDHRGHGLGRRLLDYTLEEAQRLGYHAIIARIFAHNPGSLGLHHAFGFEQMGYLKEVAEMDGVFRDVVYLVKLLR